MNINNTLDLVIKIIDNFIPDIIQSFYVTGSYSEKYYVSTSDIDGVIILKNKATKKDIEKINNLIDYFYDLLNILLDISVIKESDLLKPKISHNRIDCLIIKNKSSLVFGKDIKNDLPDIDFDSYLQDTINRPIYFISRVRNNISLSYPINYPDKDDFYFGYCNRKLFLSGEEIPSSKELVVNVGWIATALIAIKSKKMVISKNDCLSYYKKYINDEWVEFLEDIFLLCRNKWEYKIPDSIEDKNKLQSLCKQALNFENNFLDLYKNFLNIELDKGKKFKIKTLDFLLEKVFYNDDLLKEKINKLTKSKDKEIREKSINLVSKF